MEDQDDQGGNGSLPDFDTIASRTSSDEEFEKMLLADKALLARLDQKANYRNELGTGGGQPGIRGQKFQNATHSLNETSSSISKFRNQKTVVNDFDERAIFGQLVPKTKVIGKTSMKSITPHQSVKPTIPPSSESCDGRSSSPEITIVAGNKSRKRTSDEMEFPERTHLQVKSAQNTPPLEDEVDELEGEYDLSVFEQYLTVSEDEHEHSPRPTELTTSRTENHPRNVRSPLFKRAKLEGGMDSGPISGAALSEAQVMPSPLFRPIVNSPPGVKIGNIEKSSGGPMLSDPLSLPSGFIVDGQKREENVYGDFDEELSWTKMYLED